MRGGKNLILVDSSTLRNLEIIFQLLCTRKATWYHFSQRYLALDDRVAWAYYELTDELLSGETVEEWIVLSGKQGEGLEGNINVILSFHVSVWACVHTCVHSCVHTCVCACMHACMHV